MRVFKDVGLVEQLGSGMSRILKVYDKSIFKITPNFLVVTFMFDEPAVGVINEKEVLVLNLIKSNSNITKNEILQKLDISPRTVDRAIAKLKKLNIVERVGSNKTGHWLIK